MNKQKTIYTKHFVILKSDRKKGYNLKIPLTNKLHLLSNI